MFAYYRYIVEYRIADGTKQTEAYYAGDAEELATMFFKNHFHIDYEIIFKEGITIND